MSEYEILDLQASYVAALGTDIMNFISILSGYLLASYFLGDKLRLSQFVVLTATYSIIMLIVIASIATDYEEIRAAESALEDMKRTWETRKPFPSKEGTDVLKYSVIGASVLIFLGSIYFSIVSRIRSFGTA